MSENLGTNSNDIKQHGVLFHTNDGRVVAFGRNRVLPTGAGNNAINVRIPDLAEIDFVLSKETVTDGIYHQSIAGDVITGNQVGTTIFQVSGGGTITVTAIGVGKAA